MSKTPKDSPKSPGSKTRSGNYPEQRSKYGSSPAKNPSPKELDEQPPE